MKAELYITIQQ